LPWPSVNAICKSTAGAAVAGGKEGVVKGFEVAEEAGVGVTADCCGVVRVAASTASTVAAAIVPNWFWSIWEVAPDDHPARSNRKPIMNVRMVFFIKEILCVENFSIGRMISFPILHVNGHSVMIRRGECFDLNHTLGYT